MRFQFQRESGWQIYCFLNFISITTILTLSGIVCQESADSDLELQLVHILFRHGDRNPVESYPNDPWKNESFWPEGFAQLTKRGKQQQYRLGKYLRTRYGGFISSSYSPYEVHIESSDVDRTLMSAEANLAGLYPPQDPVSRWNPALQWQPIPVHTTPAAFDNKLKWGAPCPRLTEAQKEFNESTLMTRINEEHKKLYEFLSNHSGKVVSSPQQVDYLYDVLHIETLYNYTLPDWTKSVFPGEEMFNLTAFSFKVMTYTEELKRLRMGPLLKEIVGHMKEQVEDKLDARKKLFIYSAHDTTVASLLNTLGVFNDLPPPYATAIFVELYRNRTSGYSVVQVHLKNTTDHDPYLLTIPGCNSTSCLFQTFVDVTKHVIPANWEEECQKSFMGLVGMSLFALVVGSILSLILIVSMLAMVCVRRRKMLAKPAYPYLHLQMEDEDA